MVRESKFERESYLLTQEETLGLKEGIASSWVLNCHSALPRRAKAAS